MGSEIDHKASPAEEKETFLKISIKESENLGSTNDKVEEIEKAKTWPEILAINVACLIALTSGLQSAWTSPSIIALTKDKINYNISEREAALLPILPAVSMVVTCGFISNLYDKFGRKKILIFTAFPQFISWAMVILAKDIKIFYLSRIISGVGEACYFSAVPVYIGEISSPKIRGTWGNAVSFLRYFGSFLINIIGSIFSVRKTAFICSFLPVIFLVLMPFMPESPYFLIMKGRERETEKSLRQLKRKKNVRQEFLKLKSDVERQMSETGTWKDLIFIKSNRRGLVAAIFLRVAQCFGGMITFNFYNKFIFHKALDGSDASGVWSAIYSGLLCFCVFFAASAAVDVLGRKKSFIFSATSCGFILFLESAYFYLKIHKTATWETWFKPWEAWLPATGFLIYCACVSLGMATVPTLVLGELFSVEVKAKAMTLTAVTAAMAIFAANHVFYWLVAGWGLYAAFWLFGACNLVSAVASLVLVPETKGRTLEEIQQELKK